MTRSVKTVFKPQLYKRVLVFILMPLLIFTSLLFMLRQVFIDEQRSLGREIEQSEIISELGKVIVDVAQTNTKVLSYGLSENERKSLLNGDALDQWVSQLGELRSRYHMNPKGAERMSRFLFGSSDIFQLEGAGGISSLEPDLSAQMMKKIYRLIKEIDECVTIESDDLKQNRAVTDNKRRQEELIIYGGFAAAFLLSPLLFILFLRQVFAQLRTLMRNANDIGKDSAIVEPVEADNELAYLNSILMISHAKLLESSMLHRLLREMVSHDVRSPLQSALVNVQLIEEHTAEISDKAFFALDSSYKNMTGILSFVETLLESERSKNESGCRGESQCSHDENSEQAHLSEAVEKQDGRKAARPELRGLTLAHKGVMLIILPMVLQCGILAYISNQMSMTQKAIDESRSVNGILMDLQTARIKFAAGVVTSGTYAYTRSAEFLQSAEQSFLASESAIKDARLLAGRDQELSEVVNLSERVFGKQKDIAGALRTARSNEEIESILKTLSESHSPLPEAHGWREKLLAISTEATQRAARLQQAERRSSLELSRVLAWGTRISFGISIALLVWFTCDLQRRLKVLVRNASNLARTDAAFESLSGGDELSYLNKVIIGSRHRLEEDAARRKELSSSLVRETYDKLILAKDNILSFAKLEADHLPPAASVNVKRICGNIDRTAAVMNSMRSFGEMECFRLELELQQCDIDVLVSEAIEALVDVAGLKQVKLENKCESSIIECDKLRISQVLTNYITNAIKFSPKSSSIVISSQKQDGDHVGISVSDCGSGLSEEARERIFERYYQAPTAEREHGYGLGLAICKSIVESHHGKLGVENRSGGGSTFWFSLPSKHGDVPAQSVDSEYSGPSLAVEPPFADLLLATVFLGSAAILVSGTSERQLTGLAPNTVQTQRRNPQPEEIKASPELLELMKSRWTEAVIQDPTTFLKKLKKYMQVCRDKRRLFFCYLIEASFFTENDKAQAAGLYEKAAECSLFEGKENAFTGKCYAMMALCLGPLERNLLTQPEWSPGDFSKSKTLADRALRILEQYSGKPTLPKEYSKELPKYLLSTATARYVALDLLGRISLLSGKPNSMEEAAGYFSRARAIAVSELSALPQVCSTTQLACILRKQGKGEEARKLMANIENDMLKNAEPPLSRVLVLNNIGGFYQVVGEYRKSRAFYEKALAATDELTGNREMYRKIVEDHLASLEKAGK